MKKIKIAQIGTSETEHAVQVFKSLRAHPEVFEVRGFADVDRHTRPLSAVFDPSLQRSAEEILNTPDLDAVIIECDEKLQARYALMAAERGLHMHLEKPCGDDDAAFDRLIDMVEERDLVFHTGYMYRYNPAVRRALDLVKEGRLGEVYAVEAMMNCLHTDSMRQCLKEFKGGQMFYLGCHLIDLICLFQGFPLEITPLNCSTGIAGCESEDFGLALLRYPRGISMAKTVDVEPGGFMRRQLVVCGTKGTIEIRPLERLCGPETVSTEMTVWVVDENGDCPWSNEGKHMVFEPYNRYDGMLLAFASMVRGEKENPYTSGYERALHKLVLNACGA